MAYHVVGGRQVRACLEHLGLRECHLGGYSVHRVTFTDTESSPGSSLSSDGGGVAHLEALVFIASPCNHLYLGPAAVDDLARQVR